MTRTNQNDNLNRLTNLVWKVGSTVIASFAYQYNDANQRTRVTLTDGSYWLFGYDSLGQVSSGKKYWSDGTAVPGQQFEYTHDDIGNRKLVKFWGDDTGGGLHTANYGANLLNQYTNRDVPGYVGLLGTASSDIPVFLFGDNGTYLQASRRSDYFWGELSVNNGLTGFGWGTPQWPSVTAMGSINAGATDIVSSAVGHVYVPATPENYSFDLDGNQILDGRWNYGWDAENRLTNLVSVEMPSGAKLKIDLAYDWMGRRIQKDVWTYAGSVIGYVSPTRTKFVYDGWNLISILSSNSDLLTSFQWGTDASGTTQGAGGVGGLVAMTVYAGTNAGTYFYVYDGNYNVVALVNAASGNVAAQYEYGPFGELIRATGPLAQANPFLFSTKFYDWETGFYYYGYRYYNPSTGRWLSRDSVEEDGGNNLYCFAAGDPLLGADSFGLEWKVFRESGADRALATGDCGDTIRGLANIIHLDPDDYQKWLALAGDKGVGKVPGSADEPLAVVTRFTIPNKVYVNDLVHSIKYIWWLQWRRVEMRKLRGEGFKAILAKDTKVDKFRIQLSDADLHGIVVIAHGDAKAQGDYSDNDGYHVATDSLTPHHRLGGLKAIWCWSGQKAAQWQKMVSPTGYLFTADGYVFIWDTYPGMVKHGLPDAR